jgi:hypothetical protein
LSSEFEQYEKLLNSQPENETYFETIYISHSKMSQTRYFVFNSVPLTAKLITGETVEFLPANISATNASNSNDLDQQASFSIGDENNELDDELERIPLGDTEDIIVGYGIYVSTGLDAPAEFIEYTVKSIPQKLGAFTMQCGAPNLNSNETGEVYSLTRFPMLRSAV